MHYFEAGSDCWIAGFANALPAEHVQILAAAQRSEMAAGWEIQNSLKPILSDVENDHYIARTRYSLIARGIPVGPPRAPLQALGADDSTSMRNHLVELGHLTAL
jgi:4-hydroxy-tetrahydrodipicolinate synthase